MPDRKNSRLDILFSAIGAEVRALAKNTMLMFNAGSILALIFLIGFIYQKGVLSQIPLVIVDLDQTSVSRSVAEQFTANDKFDISWAPDYLSARQDIASGAAQAAIVIPPGLASGIKQGQGADILLAIDATNYIAANTIYARANETIQTVNGGLAVKILAGQGILGGEAANLVQSVKLAQKNLYNPDYNYAYYLSYGIFSAGIFSLLMSGIAVSLIREGRKKKFRISDLAAKYIVYGAFAALVTNLVFLIARMTFALPGQGSYFNFFLLTLPYGYLIALFGMIFSRFAGDELRVFQASVFFATPLIFLTGYTWPLQSIPLLLQPIYYLNPLTPMLNGVRAALVMGGGFAVVGRYTLWQLVLIGFYLMIALAVYRRRMPKKVTDQPAEQSGRTMD